MIQITLLLHGMSHIHDEMNPGFIWDDNDNSQPNILHMLKWNLVIILYKYDEN